MNLHFFVSPFTNNTENQNKIHHIRYKNKIIPSSWTKSIFRIFHFNPILLRSISLFIISFPPPGKKFVQIFIKRHYRQRDNHSALQSARKIKMFSRAAHFSSVLSIRAQLFRLDLDDFAAKICNKHAKS